MVRTARTRLVRDRGPCLGPGASCPAPRVRTQEGATGKESCGTEFVSARIRHCHEAAPVRAGLRAVGASGATGNPGVEVGRVAPSRVVLAASGRCGAHPVRPPVDR
eukprot:scaffold43097_cov62-Phaeocystis_antarctica.AAC.2